MSRRVPAGVALALATLLGAPAAFAAPPTKSQCIAASETGQDLEHAGKLHEARQKLTVCIASACPGVVRDDCTQRLEDLRKRTPSVVFAAQDGAGNDLSEVRVTMDGAPLVERLDGKAVEVDPGEHRFTFESDGLPTVTRSLVLREGEKGREETVVLKVVGKPHADSGASESPAERPATTAPHDASTGDGQRTVGLVVGAAGLVGLGIGSVLGLVSKGTYDHAMSAECGGNPADCTPQGARDGSTAHSQATMATVAFLAGGAALGAGAVLYLTAPKSGVSVGATMAPGTAQLRVVASW